MRLSTVEVLTTTALMAIAGLANAQACPTNPQFAYAVARQVRLIGFDTSTAAPRLTEGPLSANVVQFIVDSTGRPILRSVKGLRIADSTLFTSFRQTLQNLRFQPAQMSDGCKVSQLLVTNIAWASPHAP